MLTLEIHDPTGFLDLTLEDIPESTTAAEVCGRVLDEWSLSREVDWRFREKRTNTLLMPEQQLGECVHGASRRLDLTILPHAHVD